MLRYNTTCPSGWISFSFPGSTDIYCFRNGANAVAVPVQTITDLPNLGVAGTAVAGGNDTVTVTTAGSAYSASNTDDMLKLASSWQGVEFIIVGDCCGSAANFNSGASITVRTVVHNGTRNAPTCVLEGFTGETNNLNLLNTAAIAIGASPRIEFNQGTATGAVASCAAAAGVGDTHLTTFNGLLYDFQASGDFILAETGPDFLVETRQASGAPTWPNAAVNKAVGMKMGKTRIAICLEPTRIEIDGRPAQIDDGQSIYLADDLDITRHGNVYYVRGPSGDSVRAELNSTWINIGVGLGRWPSNVRGLLANAKDDVHLLATSDGTVLETPMPFETLYHRFGESWRVPRGESLMCDDKEIEEGIPSEPFFAKNLDPKMAERLRALCRKAGVKDEALLEACTLDVAVINNKDAANVFAGAPPPVAVGN